MTIDLHTALIRLTASTAETALSNLTPQTLAALRVNVKAMEALLDRMQEAHEGGNVLPFHRS